MAHWLIPRERHSKEEKEKGYYSIPQRKRRKVLEREAVLMWDVIVCWSRGQVVAVD